MWMAIKKCLVVLFGLAIQIFFTLLLTVYLGERYNILRIVYALVSIVALYILTKNNRNNSYTFPWVVVILLFPLAGGILYLILGRNKHKSKLLKKVNEKRIENLKYYKTDKKILDENIDNSQINYLSKYLKFPVTKNNKVTYYKTGEEAYEGIKEALLSAKKFIFLEYFIVRPGKMWDEILNILIDKVNQGVDVRMMYDDLGCVTMLPDNYSEFLRSKGIKCVVFNELKPIRGVIMNNRDHRKILVVDGNIAFTGGINIGDEYINKVVRFGNWKDNSIKVEGEAAYSFTIMFLTIWNTYHLYDDEIDNFKGNKVFKNNDLCIPYDDSPLDSESTGKNVYLNIINNAKRYLYISTPYLILDMEIIDALTLAIKRGVDVRIVIPGIPDKKIVYTVTESYARDLIQEGVKVYKYRKGFLHSKMFVSDDIESVVGTINLDYRSLFLHFECGLYLYKCDCIKDIKNDFESLFKNSDEITSINQSFIKTFWQTIIRLFGFLL